MSQKTFGFLAVLVVALLLSVSAQANDDELGYQIAGSWLGAGSFDVDIGCDGVYEYLGIPVTDAHTLGVGGTVVTTNPSNPNSHNGSWTKSGARQISARNLVFGLDADGNLANISVISWIVDFERGFESASATFTTNVFPLGVDPLDPASVPIICAIGQHDSLRKVIPGE